MSNHCPHCGTRLPNVRDAFCPECRRPLDEPIDEVAPVPTDKVATAPTGANARPIPASGGRAGSAGSDDQVAQLEQRVAQLEWRLQQSNLFSEHLMTRAITVWGHYMLAYLVIITPIVIIAVMISQLGR